MRLIFIILLIMYSLTLFSENTILLSSSALFNHFCQRSCCDGCCNSTVAAVMYTELWVSPPSSCRQDSVAWLWTEMTAGTCATCSLAWHQMRGPSVEDTNASAAPEDCNKKQKKIY